jgi:hypothetical protein
MAFQSAMQILLVVLMGTQTLYHEVDEDGKKVIAGSFVADPVTEKKASPLLSGLAETAGILTLFELPPLLESVAEVQLDATPSSNTVGPGQTATPLSQSPPSQ